MPTSDHHATFGVYNTWRAEMRQEHGGTFDWSRVSEEDIRDVSERMFDAADVPIIIRVEYWRRFNGMVNNLEG